jgi:hypothetical protein
MTTVATKLLVTLPIQNRSSGRAALPPSSATPAATTVRFPSRSTSVITAGMSLDAISLSAAS